METALALAFKEWAAVVRALSIGSQIVILRKGGIQDRGEAFEMQHQSFLLFPTYEHQKAEDLNELGRQCLNEVRAEPPLSDDAHITFQYVAETMRHYWITDLKKILSLSDFHIWADHVLEKRFEWGKDKGVNALVVRIYKMENPKNVSHAPEYRGCRSWVELKEPLELGPITPVLKNDILLEKMKIVHSLIV